jgi:hypothetical protein
VHQRGPQSNITPGPQSEQRHPAAPAQRACEENRPTAARRDKPLLNKRILEKHRGTGRKTGSKMCSHSLRRCCRRPLHVRRTGWSSGSGRGCAISCGTTRGRLQVPNARLTSSTITRSVQHSNKKLCTRLLRSLLLISRHQLSYLPLFFHPASDYNPWNLKAFCSSSLDMWSCLCFSAGLQKRASHPSVAGAFHGLTLLANGISGTIWPDSPKSDLTKGVNSKETGNEGDLSTCFAIRQQSLVLQRWHCWV